MSSEDERVTRLACANIAASVVPNLADRVPFVDLCKEIYNFVTENG
jgi:hypothetical protein